MTEIKDELWLLSPVGILQVPGVLVTQVEWTLAENTFHVLRASGPLSSDNPNEEPLDPALLVLDARFEVHRYLDGVALGIEGDTQFLLRSWDIGQDDQGATTWTIEAYSPEFILTGRIVDSYASTDNDVNPLTTKSGPADDVIKELVDENIGPSVAIPNRRVAELSIDADLSAAPAIDKSCAWDQLFGVLQDIAADAAYNGTWLSWGMVASGNGTGFTFRTWTGKRGVDHTAGSDDEVIVSNETGNLLSPRVLHDHRLQVTAMRGLGKGEGQSRLSWHEEDSTAVISPWGYYEAKLETQVENLLLLRNEVQVALWRGRPVLGFTGKMLDTNDARYGERIKLGDLVTATYGGESFACRLSKVSGKWSKDGEFIEIDLIGSIPGV